MDCNNTLTNAELKVMLVVTEEEIQQQMECPIERTQHKCRKCATFSNEAALKQHHCEPLIKKEKWPHCGKAINCTNNLEKHLNIQ